MLWLDWLLITEASAELVSSAWNCGYFVRHAAQARLTARRAAAFALSLANGAMALEASYFLAWSLPANGLEQAMVILVRSALLASSAFISLLIWRHGARRR